MNIPSELPAEVSACHTLIQQLAQEQSRQELLIAKLQHQLEQMLRHRYGQRSDRIDPENPGLFSREAILELLGDLQPSPEAKKETVRYERRQPSSGHGRKPLPEHLSRERVVCDISAEEKLCSNCGSEKIKLREEVTEQLEYRPAKLYVKQFVQPVYACPRECEGQMVMGQKPSQPIEKGLAGPSLLAHVATAKYCDHLPLNRQRDEYRRAGVALAASTLSDWMRQTADLAEPLVQLMRNEVLKSRRIHTDDTPVPVLDGDRTQTKTGRFWAYVGDEAHPYTVYDYTDSRKRDGPENFLEGYSGYLQADAYGGYDRLYSEGQVVEVACWAHARRKFVEAKTSDLLGAMVATAYISVLYDVEREAKELSSAEPEEKRHTRLVCERLRLRAEKSRSILADFERWLGKYQQEALVKSPIGQAISYTQSNWEALRRYLEDGELEIDNNAAERAMRPVAIGRKNWLFAGSDRGAHTGAVLYSLVASCKRHGIDPYEYLSDILARLPDLRVSRLPELLPDRWAKTREEQFPKNRVESPQFS